MLIAGVWLFFSCIYIIQAFNESKIYDMAFTQSPVYTRNSVGKKIVNIQDTLKASDAIKKQEYEKALQLISGDTSEDYYNRATIQTLLAYKNALQSTILWLQNAQTFLAQAQQNFTISRKLSTSIITKNAITNNEKATSSLSTVIDIKTCYTIGQTIIMSINDIDTMIKSIKNTLKQEEMYIDKRSSSLHADCYEKLHNIIDTSKEQVGLLQLQMQKNNNTYTSDFTDKIENPSICIQTPYENILPSIIKGKEWLWLYEQQHINTIEALKSNDSQSIKELCDQSKNDAQINQQIESSVQELLQKLEDNKTNNKPSSNEKEQKRSSNEVQYKDFFNENEQKALQDIQNTNQWRINTILDIRGKGNYNPERYINDMFNQFYGNSGDFINLHK